MDNNQAPLIALGGDSKAPVINYNVPEPTSYAGKNVIELTIPEDYFTDLAFVVPEVADDENDTTGDAPFGGTTPIRDNILDIDIGVLDPSPPSDPNPPSDTPPVDGDEDIDADDVLDGKGPYEPPVDAALLTGGRGAQNPRRRTRSRKRRVASTTEIIDPSQIELTVTLKDSVVSWIPMTDGTFDVASSKPLSQQAASIAPIHFLTYAEKGYRPVLQKNMYGTYDWHFLAGTAGNSAAPRLLLVESYRLSSYLGAYGAGRTINTFSLLPGEKTTISVKTFRNTDESYQSSSSILDSVTEASSQEFEDTLASEQSDKQSESKSSEYHLDAEVSANWGWGSASVSGGTSSESSSTREEFAKNVSSATEKSSMSASAKRDVQVETSFEVSTQTGEETSITREIENINAGRTLNFVFRQMNQEFITLLHLTDVRVGFFNGFNETKNEATLPNTREFLNLYVKPEHVDEVYDMLKSQLGNVFDYQGNHHSFVEDKVLKDSSGDVVAEYLRAKVESTMSYQNHATGTDIVAQGVITNATTSVLRTEGVIVESLIGIAPALDDYSTALQDERVKEKGLQNEALALENKRLNQGISIVAKNDADRASLYQDLFVDADDPESAESIE